MTAAAVETSLIAFIFSYGIVFSAGMYYIFQLARKGPDEGPLKKRAGPDEPILGVPLAMGRDEPAEA